MIRRTLTKVGRALLPEALKGPLRKRIQKGNPMPANLPFGIVEEKGVFTARIPNGSRVRIPLQILSEFRSNFENDWDEMQSFLEIAKDAQVLFDVGADKGVMAATFAALGAKKQSFAYEPSPSGCTLMSELLSLNALDKQVEIIPKVVAERSGKVSFSQEESGYVQIVPVDSANELEAESVSLDDECARLELAPDLVKIDVEGYEGEVLQGAEKLLAESGPTICLEVHLSYLEKRGIEPADILRMLERKGYLIFSLEGDRVSPEKAVNSVRQIIRVVCRKD